MSKSVCLPAGIAWGLPVDVVKGAYFSTDVSQLFEKRHYTYSIYDSSPDSGLLIDPLSGRVHGAVTTSDAATLQTLELRIQGSDEFGHSESRQLQLHVRGISARRARFPIYSH